MDQKYVYKKVGAIELGIMSPKIIKDMSTVKVVTPELYDREGYPVDGGLMDIRMGVIDPGLTCPVDGKKLKDCPGYFGFIELARPIIHIHFVPLILNLLRGTCRETGLPNLAESKVYVEIETLKKLKETSNVAYRSPVHSIDGTIIARQLFEVGLLTTSESIAAVRETVLTERRSVEQAITDEEVPRKYHDLLRHYFGQLEELTEPSVEETTESSD